MEVKQATPQTKAALALELQYNAAQLSTWQEKCDLLTPYNLDQFFKNIGAPSEHPEQQDFTIASVPLLMTWGLADIMEPMTTGGSLTDSLISPEFHGTGTYREMFDKLVSGEIGMSEDIFEVPRGGTYGTTDATAPEPRPAGHAHVHAHGANTQPHAAPTFQSVDAIVRSQVLGVVQGDNFQAGDIIEIPA